MTDEGQKIIDELAAESKRVNSAWLNHKPLILAVGCSAAGVGLMLGTMLGYLLKGPCP